MTVEFGLHGAVAPFCDRRVIDRLDIVPAKTFPLSPVIASMLRSADGHSDHYREKRAHGSGAG